MTDNNNTQHIVWHDDAIIKQLISYAVGCMLGRYRLDKPGLHIAHPNPTDEEIAPYEYKGEQWEIDDDGIMPLMPNDCGFSDKLDARRAELTTKETKQLQALQKQLDECREYHERLQVVAEQAISFDLEDGVVVNYAKFGDILQKIK